MKKIVVTKTKNLNIEKYSFKCNKTFIYIRATIMIKLKNEIKKRSFKIVFQKSWNLLKNGAKIFFTNYQKKKQDLT